MGKADKHSETWQAVINCVEQEQAKIQKSILTKGVSHDDSNYWRGYHAALTKIAGLADTPEVIKPVTTTY